MAAALPGLQGQSVIGGSGTGQACGHSMSNPLAALCLKLTMVASEHLQVASKRG